jgi:peptidyl-prolyl cis-trans isomerase D
MATLRIQKQKTALEKKAEARLNLFQGKDIGFVSRDSVKNIVGLTKAQSLQFINFVFDNNKIKNYKVIANKAVLYKILEQNLLVSSKANQYIDLVKANVLQMKRAELNQNLVKMLSTRYSIEQYYKGN